jgi:PAS domain S-box-containing protein
VGGFGGRSTHDVKNPVPEEFIEEAVEASGKDVPAAPGSRPANHKRMGADAFLAAVVESSEDGIISKNLDGIITSWNPAAERIFGYQAEEVIGHPVYILIPPELVDEEAGILQRLKRGERIDHYETVRLRKDDRRIDVSLTISPIRNRNGRIVGASKIVRDITERKRIEMVIRESEERYRTLFNSIDEGFCVVEVLFDGGTTPVDYRFLEVNPSFEKQTGLINAKGKRMRELAPEHEEYWFEIYGKIALSGEPARFENYAEQLERWYDVFAFPFGDSAKRQVAILFNDITGRKRSEESLAKAKEELEHHTRNLEATVAERTTHLQQTIAELESVSYSLSVADDSKFFADRFGGSRGEARPD